MGDEEVLLKRRSDGRMKSYTSVLDARAWCDKREDRRQYILDIIRRGYGKATYLPVDEIVNLLMQNNQVDCKKLELENEELRRLLERRHQLKSTEIPTRDKFEHKQINGRRLSSNTFRDTNILGKVSVTTSTSTLQKGNQDKSKSLQNSHKEPIKSEDKKQYGSKTINQISISPSLTVSTSTSTLKCKSHDSVQNKGSDPKKDLSNEPIRQKLDSMRKLVDLESHLLEKKQSTKEKMDHLKSTFSQLKKELEAEKSRNNSLIFESTDYTKAIENLQKDIAAIKSENRKDKQKILELSIALKNILQKMPINCKCGKSSKDNLEVSKLELEILPQERKKTFESIKDNLRSPLDNDIPLDRQLEECKAKLAAKEKSYESLLQKCQQDEEYKKKVEELAKKAIANKSELETKIKATRNSLNSVVSKVSDYEKLKMQNEQLCAKIKDLEEELKEEKAKCNAIAPLKEELQRVRSSTKSLKEELKSALEENKYLRKLSSQIQENAKKQISQLQAEKYDISRRSQQFEQLNSDLKLMQDHKDVTLSDLQLQLARLKDELKQETEFGAACKAKLAELQEKVLKISPDGSFSEFYDKNREIERLKQEIKKLQEENNTIKAKHEMDLHKSNSEIATLKNTVNNLRQSSENSLRKMKLLEEKHSEDLIGLKEINQNLKDEASSIIKQEKEQIAKLEAENKILKAEVGTLRTELYKLQNKSAQDLLKIVMMQKEGNNLENELSQYKIAKEGECTEYKVQLEEIKKENETLKANNIKLEEEMKHLKETTQKNIDETCAEMQKTINELALQLQGEEKQVKELKKELDKTKSDKDDQDLLLIIEKLESENKSLKTNRPSLIPQKVTDKDQNLTRLERKPSRLPVAQKKLRSCIKRTSSIDSYSTESSVTHKHEPKKTGRCQNKKCHCSRRYNDEELQEIKHGIVCSDSKSKSLERKRAKSRDRSSCSSRKSDSTKKTLDNAVRTFCKNLNRPSTSHPKSSRASSDNNSTKCEVLVKKDPRTSARNNNVGQFHSLSEHLEQYDKISKGKMGSQVQIRRRSYNSSICTTERSLSDTRNSPRTICVKEFKGIKVKVDVDVIDDKRRIQEINKNLRKIICGNSGEDPGKDNIQHMSTEVIVVAKPGCKPGENKKCTELCTCLNEPPINIDDVEA